MMTSSIRYLARAVGGLSAERKGEECARASAARRTGSSCP